MLGFTYTGEINNKAHLLVIFKDIVRDLVGKKNAIRNKVPGIIIMYLSQSVSLTLLKHQ